MGVMISRTPRITVRDREGGRDVVSREVPRSGRYRSRNKKWYMYQTCRTDCDARERKEAVGSRLRALRSMPLHCFFVGM